LDGVALNSTRRRRQPHLAVVSAYPPDKGRLSEYSHALLSAISRRGLLVRVGSDSASGTAESLEVEDIWKPDDIPSIARILKFVVESRARIAVFNISFAVYGKSRLANFIGFANVFLAAQLGKIMGFKTIAIVHNLPEASNTAKFGLRPTFVNRTGLLVAERMLFSCQVVAVTLRLYKRMLERRFRRAVFYLPHGAWKDERGNETEPETKRILFFGFLSPGKDMALLRGIFDELRAKHNDLQLRVIASPHPNIPASSEVLQWFRGSPGIEVRGYAAEEELAGAFDDCRAVVLPYSASMGTSGVLHLANSFGVPAVTTNLPELREIQSEGAGVIVCSSRRDMVASLDRLVSDAQYWRAYSARARAYSSKIEWDKIAERLLTRIATS
jgi:glycosyltransferase involved in cell wall biosynthesis